MRSVVGQHAAHARSHARNESHLGASTQHEHIGVGAGGEWAAHSSAARAGPPVLQQSVCRQAKLEGVQLGRWCPFYQQGGKNGVHKGAWQRLGWGHITRRGVMPPLSLHCAGGTWHPRVASPSGALVSTSFSHGTPELAACCRRRPGALAAWAPSGSTAGLHPAPAAHSNSARTARRRI